MPPPSTPAPFPDASAVSRGLVNASPTTQVLGGPKSFNDVVTLTKTTGNTLVVDTSTFVVDATNNRIGIGTASVAVSTVQVGATIDAFDPVATFVVNTLNPPTGYSEGFDSNVAIRGSYDTLNGQIVGIFGTVDYASSVVTTGEMIGVWGWASADSVDVGSLIGVVGFARRSGAGTVTNASGLHSQGFFDGSGTITRGYGLYLQNSDGDATTGYQIFSEGTTPDTAEHFYTSNPGTQPFVLTSKNRVGIGTITPANLLHIVSAGSASEYSRAAFISSDYSGTGLSQAVRVTSVRSGSSGAVSQVVGLDCFHSLTGGTGTITMLASVMSKTDRTAGPTVTNQVGFYAQSNGAAGATLNAGFYCGGQTGGTTIAGFYCESFIDAQHPFYYAGSAGRQFVVKGNGWIGIGHTVPDSYLHIVGTATGTGTAVHLSPGSYAFTGTKYGLLVDTLSGGTVSNYSLWATGNGDGASWQVSNTSRVTGWVARAHPSIATYVEGLYQGVASQTSVAGINDLTSAYIDTELFDAVNITGQANAILGSVYWNKTGGTVFSATSVLADFYSDTATGTLTTHYGFRTQYTWNATPTITSQYGIRLASVDKGVSRWGLYVSSIPRIAGESRAIRYGDTGQFNFIVEDDASTWVWTEGTDSGSKAAGLGTNINLAFYGGCGPNSVPLPGPSTVHTVMGFWADPWWWDQDVAVGTLAVGYHSTPHNTGTTLTDLVGYSAIPQLGTGTTTNMSGFWSRTPVVGTGVVTNAYGIRIDALTLGTGTNTAIGYDVGGPRQFLVGGDGVVTYRADTGITAFAGGGQGSATQLTAEHNFVVTVATAADSVKLPTAVLGKSIVVFNRHATNSCDVFPASGGAIDALGTNVAYALAAGASRVFYGQSATQWHSR